MAEGGEGFVPEEKDITGKPPGAEAKTNGGSHADARSSELDSSELNVDPYDLDLAVAGTEEIKKKLIEGANNALRQLRKDLEKNPAKPEDDVMVAAAKEILAEDDLERREFKDHGITPDSIEEGIRLLELESRIPSQYRLSNKETTRVLLSFATIPDALIEEVKDNPDTNTTKEDLAGIYEQITKKLEADPDSASFEDLIKIMDKEVEDIENIIKSISPEDELKYPEIADRLRKAKTRQSRVRYAKEAAESRVTGIPLAPDPNVEDPALDHRSIALDLYLREDKIDQLTRAKKEVKDPVQLAGADAAIAFFGSLHDQLFQDEEE